MNSFCLALKSYRPSNSQVLQLYWTKYSSVAVTESNIKIPNRIPRGPTDILKALEKTVSYDISGPAYKFHDDPFLAPYNDRQQRAYSLSKNAGRKAARWVRDEHPELFTQVISDPPVMSYMPSQPINEETVNENLLFQKICDCKVTEAMKVLELMQSKNMDISQEAKLALLELLCFYNCEDPIPNENIAERFYTQSERRDYSVNLWKGEPMVKALFDSLEPMGSAPYSALLCGLYTYGAKPEGDELLLKVKEKKIILDVHAYNACILRIISKYEKSDMKRDMVVDTLKEMNEMGVKPNLGTLNAAMDVLCRLGYKDKYNHLVQLMADFTRIGVKPSIGTYALFIRGHLSKSHPHHEILHFIKPLLKSMQGKSLEIRHKSDVQFFDWVIRACVMCEDLGSAIEALELLLTSRNRTLLDATRSQTFFNNFFRLLISKSDFPTLLDYYRKLVPHTYSPSPQFYEMLFDACDVNLAVKEIPGFWKDYVASGSLDSRALMKMLEVSVNLSGLPDEAAVNARKELGELATQLWNFKINAEQGSGERLYVRDPISPELCNLLITLFGRGGQWRSLQSCLRWMAKEGHIPEEQGIHHALESSYEQDKPSVSVWLLKFCHNAFKPELQLKSMATKFMKSDFLTESMKKELEEVFDESSESSSSSESDAEGESSSSDADSSDSEDISIPRKTQKDSSPFKK